MIAKMILINVTWNENVGAWLAPSACTTRYWGVIPRDWNLSWNDQDDHNEEDHNQNFHDHDHHHHHHHKKFDLQGSDRVRLIVAHVGRVLSFALWLIVVVWRATGITWELWSFSGSWWWLSWKSKHHHRHHLLCWWGPGALLCTWGWFPWVLHHDYDYDDNHDNFDDSHDYFHDMMMAIMMTGKPVVCVVVGIVRQRSEDKVGAEIFLSFSFMFNNDNHDNNNQQ